MGPGMGIFRTLFSLLFVTNYFILVSGSLANLRDLFSMQGKENCSHDKKRFIELLKLHGDQNIVKEGQLFVQSRNLWRIPSNVWKQRYFVLNKDFLYFYKKGKSTDRSPRVSPEVIPLNENLGLYPEEACGKHLRFCIRITNGKRIYNLCANSEMERDSWLTAILSLITEQFLGRPLDSSRRISVSEDNILSDKSVFDLSAEEESFSRYSWFSPDSLDRKRSIFSSHSKSTTNIPKAISLFQISERTNPRYSYVMVI